MSTHKNENTKKKRDEGDDDNEAYARGLYTISFFLMGIWF